MLVQSARNPIPTHHLSLAKAACPFEVLLRDLEGLAQASLLSEGAGSEHLFTIELVNERCEFVHPGRLLIGAERRNPVLEGDPPLHGAGKSCTRPETPIPPPKMEPGKYAAPSCDFCRTTPL